MFINAITKIKSVYFLINKEAHPVSLYRHPCRSDGLFVIVSSTFQSGKLLYFKGKTGNIVKLRSLSGVEAFLLASAPLSQPVYLAKWHLT